MDMDKLTSLGFVVTAGQIDRGNVNYGFLTAEGPVLTPEGEALARTLDAPAVEEAPVAPKRGRPRKVEAEVASS